MNLQVLFENNNLLIINKPSGLVVHPDGKTNEPTVVDWLLTYCPEIKGVGEDMILSNSKGKSIEIDRPGIVHRLDRDTSGCMVIAKTNESFHYLKEQFKRREVQKTYVALVFGSVKNNEDIIDVPIGKSRKDFRMKLAGPHARGFLREAQTHYNVIARYEDEKHTDKQKQTLKYSLIELSPKTGRTHQIRVHLKYINYPIVSDPLYAGKRKPVLGINRTALHAKAIRFLDIDKTPISVTCSLPQDIELALQQLKPIS